MNKIDLVKPENLLGKASKLAKIVNFEKIFMISAKKGKGVEDLVRWLSEQMPQGPFLFDPNDLSDMPQRQLASEILREKWNLANSLNSIPDCIKSNKLIGSRDRPC